MSKAAAIRTETKPFGHVFNPNPSPCVPGWSCCMCGWFVEKLDDYAKARVCGYVTYPVPSGQAKAGARGSGASRKSRGARRARIPTAK